MKEIMAIIRMNRINDTKAALVEAGFPAFTARKVMGRGKKALDEALLKAMDNGTVDSAEALPLLAQGPRLMPKRMLTLVVHDDQVKEVVDTLIKCNQSRNPGDGKIFVMPVRDVYRVRTGEAGDIAIDEMTGNGKQEETT